MVVRAGWRTGHRSKRSAAGFSTLFQWAFIARESFPAHINPLVFFPIVILMYYAALLVHESGHLLAGLIVGFRVDHMRVGPLLFRPPLRVSVQRHNLYGRRGTCPDDPLWQRRIALQDASLRSRRCFSEPALRRVSSLAVLANGTSGVWILRSSVAVNGRIQSGPIHAAGVHF